MSKKDYYYYFICWIVFSSLTATVKVFFNVTIYSQLIPAIFSLNLGFFIIGHFLTNIIDLKMNKNIFISIIATVFICIFVNVFYTANNFYVNEPSKPPKLDAYSIITITILTICIFYLAIYYIPKIKIPHMLGKILSDVGSATFGIYLLHMIVIHYTKRIDTFLSGHMNKLIAVILYDFVIFIIGYIITKILQKIPYVKKII